MAPTAAPAATLALVLVALILPTHPIAAPAEAQVPGAPCLSCAVELETLEWNGTGTPGSSVGGTFRLRNAGQIADDYTVTATIDNDTWPIDLDTETFEDVPPGEGLLASNQSTRTFQVRVAIPTDAAAGATAAINVTVQSDNAADANDSTTTVATAAQTYGWQLTCTSAVEVRKSDKTDIALTARNTGNGVDRATITLVPPPDGIVAVDPTSVNAAPGASHEQTVELGVGLGVPDRDYHLRWDLRSTGATNSTAACTTILTVTGGAPVDPGNDDNKDSPAAPLLLVLGALALALARRRW